VQARAQVEGPGKAAQIGQEVLGVEDADDLVHRLLEDRHARVQLVSQEGKDLGGRSRHVQAEHVRPRHHDLAHQRVLELEDLVDHLALGAVHHALAGAHVHECAQLGLRDLGFALPPLRSDKAQRHGGEPVQYGAHRPEQHRQPGDWLADPAGVSLRVLYGERHRQYLPEDHEQHRHRADGDGQARGTEELLRHRRGESRGGDVDERDADQERDEKLVRTREERHERALRGTPLLGQPLQPRAPEREIGRLGAGEKRGEEHESNQARELEAGQAIH
jgi:hypothetical protein